MLRVTIHDSPSELRLHLEGKLAGLWVRELKLCWQAARVTTRNKRATVDLRDVYFVDCAGEQLLAAMHRDGATLLAAGLMTQNLVSNIIDQAEAAAQKRRRSRSA